MLGMVNVSPRLIYRGGHPRGNVGLVRSWLNSFRLKLRPEAVEYATIPRLPVRLDYHLVPNPGRQAPEKYYLDPRCVGARDAYLEDVGQNRENVCQYGRRTLLWTY